MDVPMEDYRPPYQGETHTPSEFRPNTADYVSQEALLARGESNAPEWENQEPLMDMNEVPQETTLFDIFPRLDAPLRIDPPPSMKLSRAPVHHPTSTRDEQIRQTAFSPTAFRQRSQIDSKEEVLPGKLEAQGMTVTSIKDYSILSLSAKRAGKRTIEGAAYYSMGVLYDNLSKYTKAIEQYSKFLHVCESTEDALGQALAYNYLGLDSMLLACPSQKGSNVDGGKPLSEEAQKLLEKAIGFHTEHLQVADEGGQFVANINLGICASQLRDYSTANYHYEEAMKVALDLQSPNAQSIAVGNLGLTAIRQGDQAAAEAYLRQHLQLTREIGDKGSELEALLRLGQLQKDARRLVSRSFGRYDEALTYYHEATYLAEDEGERAYLKRISCLIGVLQGDKRLDEHMAKLKQRAI